MFIAAMAAGRRELWIVVILLFTVVDSQTLQIMTIVTAKAGDDCVLRSSGPSNSTVTALRCHRQDLQENSPFVFFYRHEKVQTAGQDPSFSKRVALLDPDFSTGDLSLVIMNVKVEDSGTYECEVKTSDKTREVSRVSLEVLPDGEEPPTNTGDADTWRDALILVCVLLAVAVIALGVLFKKHHTLVKTNQRENKIWRAEQDQLSEKV